MSWFHTMSGGGYRGRVLLYGVFPEPGHARASSDR